MISKCSPITESIVWECPDVHWPFDKIILGICCLILTSRFWQVLPIYVELHRQIYILTYFFLKIGNLSLCVELKAVLVVSIGLKLTAWYTKETILSAKDWLAEPTQGSLKYTGNFGGPKVLFLFLNLVTVNLILSSMTSRYPLLLNISLITLSSCEERRIFNPEITADI